MIFTTPERDVRFVTNYALYAGYIRGLAVFLSAKEKSPHMSKGYQHEDKIAAKNSCSTNQKFSFMIRTHDISLHICIMFLNL